MPCAAACPARPERAGASARARAARRLRRLVRGLTPHRAAATAATEDQIMSPCAAAPRGTRAVGPDDAPCLAARALSQMLCDEPNAARYRATVWRTHWQGRAALGYSRSTAIRLRLLPLTSVSFPHKSFSFKSFSNFLGRFKISLQISFPDSIHWDNGHKRPQTATSPTAARQGSGGMSTPGLTPPAA